MGEGACKGEGGRGWRMGKRVALAAHGQQGMWKGGAHRQGEAPGRGWGRWRERRPREVVQERRLGEGAQGRGLGEGAQEEAGGGGAPTGGAQGRGRGNEEAWHANAVCAPPFVAPRSRALLARGGGMWMARVEMEGVGRGNRRGGE